MEGDSARLQSGRVQQVFNHGGQPVCFRFDHSQAFIHHRLVPFDILAPERAGVAFDQSDWGFQFVADNRDEAGFELLRLPETGDIAH